MNVAELYVLLGLRYNHTEWNGVLVAFEAIKVAGEAIVSVVNGIGDAISGAAEDGVKINKLSAQLGLSAEQIQDWGYVAKQAGSSMESFGRGLRMMERQLYALQNGSKNKQFSAALSQMGLTAEDVTKALQSPDGLNNAMFKLADKFKEMGDTPERAAIAQQLFGARASEMVADLSRGGDALKALIEHYHDLNAALDDDQVSSLKGLHNAIDDVKTQFTGFLDQAIANIAPSITELLGGLSSWLSEHHDQILGVIQAVGRAGVAVGHAVGSAISSVVDWFEEHAEQFKAFFTGIYHLAVSLFTSLGGGVDGFTTTAGNGLADLLEKIGDVADGLSALVDDFKDAEDAIVQPMIDAFDALEDAWNDTIGQLIGGLNEFKDQVPGHVFGTSSSGPKKLSAKERREQEKQLGEAGEEYSALMESGNVGAAELVYGDAMDRQYQKGERSKEAAQVTVGPTTNNITIHTQDAKGAREEFERITQDHAQRQWRQAAAVIGSGSGVDADVGVGTGSLGD